MLFITKKRDNYQQEKQFKFLICYLISVDLHLLEGAQNDEVQMTRRRLNGVRLKAVKQRVALEYAMEQQITKTVIPR